jgi:Predicted membrane-bound mannosyltransferase
MFSLFGPSDFVGRLLPALFGFALIPLVYAIYRIGYLTKTQTLFAALFLAISPDMVFFSRFLRHDIFMLFFTMLLVVALFYYFERGKTRFVIIGAVAIAGALCCKEEMPVILIIFATFFGYGAWKKKWILPPHWKKDLVVCVVIVLCLMGILYSAFGAHIETLQYGWLDAIKHWTDMHNQQRLGGPWFYYVPLYLLYELPIFLLAMVATLQFIVSGITPAHVFLRAKNWLVTRRYELPVGELAHVSLRQIQSARAGISKSDEFFRFCIY